MKRIKLLLTQVIALIGFWLIITIPVLATVEGMLISSDNSNLAIYPQPNKERSAIASANRGNKVMILEQAYNNQGEIWDRIRLVNFPQTEGWISDSYVAKEQKEKDLKDPYNSQNYYQLNQFQFSNKH